MKLKIALMALVVMLGLFFGSPCLAEDIAVDLEDVVPERTFREGSEKFEFQAEVTRLMDIIINSLYSNKDIFLRELISNSADALDKMRFIALTDKEALGEGDAAKLDIHISVEDGVLKLRDSGVGMTRQELVNNLGTIARSGTSSFLEKFQKAGDINLIGQFGVGFYSVYLVADYVEVITKNNDGPQLIWESTAEGSFAISEDTVNPSIGRGTEIRIYLKEEAQEYAEASKLRDLVARHSEFINFPIYLEEEKEIEEEVELETEVSEEEFVIDSDEEVADDDDLGEDSEYEIVEEEVEVEMTTVTRTIKEWSLLNDNKAIWQRPASEVEEEDYNDFFNVLSKGPSEKPLAHAHFKAEGDIEFKAILYIPENAPFNFYESYYAPSDNSSLKLYVRKVFISDDLDTLVPRYLSFLVGIVDSDTLPVNLSRETLQQHASLKTIKKKLVRKALDMFRKLAENTTEEDEEDENTTDDDIFAENTLSKYDKFWNTFGRSIKLGIIEDTSNRSRLAKLLRFNTSKSKTTLQSLEDYVTNMKENQKVIYYISGNSLKEVEASPFLEQLLRKGFEVIYFTDALDEYLMQHLLEFDDKKFQNVSKDGINFGDGDDADEKKVEKELKKEFEPLTTWWKDLLPGNDVEAVKVSRRLVTTPCIVTTSKYGWSANMERIMGSQAMGDSNGQNQYMKGKKTLEINPHHPIIKTLKQRSEDGGDDAKEVAKVMYETALLESGFSIVNPQDFAKRVYDLMIDNLKHEGGLDVDIKEIEEFELELENEEPEEEIIIEEEDAVFEEDDRDEL